MWTALLRRSQPAWLLLNEVATAARSLSIRLESVESNRDDIGARVALLRAGRDLTWRRVPRDGSYLSASDVRVHFGLGNVGDAAVEVIGIVWLNGLQERWERIDLNFPERDAPPGNQVINESGYRPQCEPDLSLVVLVEANPQTPQRQHLRLDCQPVRGGAHPDDPAPARAQLDLVDQRGDLVDWDDRIRGPRRASFLVDQTDLVGICVYFEPGVFLLLISVLVCNKHVHFPELRDVGGEDRWRDQCR